MLQGNTAILVFSWIKSLCTVFHCVMQTYNKYAALKGLYIFLIIQLRVGNGTGQKWKPCLLWWTQLPYYFFSYHYHYSIEFLIAAPNLPYFESSLAPKYAISLSSAAGASRDVLKFHFASPFFLAACCVHQLSKSFHPRGDCISLVMYCVVIQFKFGLKIKILIIGSVVV